MTEWWTYQPSDFLMFSPQVYWRLVARYNAAFWPGHLVAIAAGCALPWLLRAQRERWQRAALLLLALAWSWVGWAFHWRFYSEIFLGARWVAAAFGLQALLLAAASALRPRLPQQPPRFGVLPCLLLPPALLYPLLAPLTGHPWSEAEVIGFMPEPTALATLSVLLAVRSWPVWSRWLLAGLPVLSLLLGAMTRWLIAQ